MSRTLEMNTLPAALGGSSLVAWRIDSELHARGWDSGIGAERLGGRWNARGTRAVYCAVDMSTSMLEVAVHKGFDFLDATANVLTRMVIDDVSSIRIVHPDELPNPMWRFPGIPGQAQMRFGTELLKRHGIVVFPSCVSAYSWNLVFEPALALGRYRVTGQERLHLDGRLNPPLP